jgi:hypothetical protein
LFIGLFRRWSERTSEYWSMDKRILVQQSLVWKLLFYGRDR